MALIPTRSRNPPSLRSRSTLLELLIVRVSSGCLGRELNRRSHETRILPPATEPFEEQEVHRVHRLDVCALLLAFHASRAKPLLPASFIGIPQGPVYSMVRLSLAALRSSLTLLRWQTKHGILGLFRSVYYNGEADGIKFVSSLLFQPALTLFSQHQHRLPLVHRHWDLGADEPSCRSRASTL